MPLTVRYRIFCIIVGGLVENNKSSIYIDHCWTRLPERRQLTALNITFYGDSMVFVDLRGQINHTNGLSQCITM